MYDGQFVKTTLNLFSTSFTNPINPNSFSSTFPSDSRYDSPVEYDTQQSKGIFEKVNTFLSTNVYSILIRPRDSPGETNNDYSTSCLFT